MIAFKEINIAPPVIVMLLIFIFSIFTIPLPIIYLIYPYFRTIVTIKPIDFFTFTSLIIPFLTIIGCIVWCIAIIPLLISSIFTVSITIIYGLETDFFTITTNKIWCGFYIIQEVLINS